MATFTDEMQTFLTNAMTASKKISELTTIPTGAAPQNVKLPAYYTTDGMTHQIGMDALKELSTLIEKHAYGIEWYDGGSDFVITRVADNMNLHKANHSDGLPVQKKMKRVLMADDGTINATLNDIDSRYTSSGAIADLTGASGQVMVRLPKYYYKAATVGTAANGNPIYSMKIVDDAAVQAVNGMTVEGTLGDDIMTADGYLISNELYVAAFLMSDKSSSRYISASAATSVASNRITFLDNSGYIVRESGNIEYPNQSLSDGSKRKYCSARSANAAATLRGANWFAHLYAAQKKMSWLFSVEYGTFNAQLAVNSSLTADGYRQGGLGQGFSTGLDFMGDGSGWSYNNAYSVPNGITVGLGNISGEVDFYPSEEAQLMRRWAINRTSILPSLEVLATAAGANATTTITCKAGGFVIVQNTPTGQTSSTDYVLQNISGADIAIGSTVSIAGGTGFAVHTASDTDYIYCIVVYGNIGVLGSSTPTTSIILPEGGFIFVQNYNTNGTGKMFVITTSTTTDGTKTINDYIANGVLIPAIASDRTNVLKHQYVFNRATIDDTTTARGYWLCNTASAFTSANIANFSYIQDEYHYTHINSYRGIEFPFGYIWQWATDIIFDRNASGTLDVWQCVDITDLKNVIGNNSVLTYTGSLTSTMSAENRAAHLDGVHWKKIGTAPAVYGNYVKEIGLGDTAETYPYNATGATSSSYFGDIYYCQYNIATQSVGNMTCMMIGAGAESGASCGLFTVGAGNAVGDAFADCGSRLCHE
jgi:hypothetical protein